MNFFRLILIVSVIMGATAGSEVTLFKRPNHKGVREKVSVTQCTNLKKFPGNVGSINTHGTCVRVYANVDCNGRTKEIMSRSPAHDNLVSWGLKDKIKSVGPCKDPCDVEITGDTPKELVVILFGKDSGNQKTLVLNPTGCTRIEMPAVYGILSSESECVQLYNSTDCSLGNQYDSIEMRRGTPFWDNLQQWGYWDKEPNFKSISHCSYKCQKAREQSPNGRLQQTREQASQDEGWDQSQSQSDSDEVGAQSWENLQEQGDDFGQQSQQWDDQQNVEVENFDQETRQARSCHDRYDILSWSYCKMFGG